jgi:hypothetical protein
MAQPFEHDPEQARVRHLVEQAVLETSRTQVFNIGAPVGP